MDRTSVSRALAKSTYLEPMRRGLALDEASDVAQALHGDGADLIQKAVGWMLREAGCSPAPDKKPRTRSGDQESRGHPIELIPHEGGSYELSD